MYSVTSEAPAAWAYGNGATGTYSATSAFWAFNVVSNYAYEVALMTHPLRFGVYWRKLMVHRPLLCGGVDAHQQCPLGSVASYLNYADVRLHIPMTHRNDRYPNYNVVADAVTAEVVATEASLMKVRT